MEDKVKENREYSAKNKAGAPHYWQQNAFVEFDDEKLRDLQLDKEIEISDCENIISVNKVELETIGWEMECRRKLKQEAKPDEHTEKD